MITHLPLNNNTCDKIYFLNIVTVFWIEVYDDGLNHLMKNQSWNRLSIRINYLIHMFVLTKSYDYDWMTKVEWLWRIYD